MAKKNIFSGFGRILLDKGEESREIISGFNRISIDDDRGAETQIIISSNDGTDDEEDDDEEEVEDAVVQKPDTTEQVIVVVESNEEEAQQRQEEHSDTVTEAIGKLEPRMEAIEAAILNTQHKDQLLRDMHKELESLKNNFYDTLRRPIIKSIIAIHRRMDERLNYIEAKLDADKGDAATDYQALFTEVHKNMDFDRTAILDTLEDEYDLNYFVPTVGEAYNPKEENAVKVEETDQPVLGGTIKDVIYGGYKESRTGRIFLKANITVYRFKKEQ